MFKDIEKMLDEGMTPEKLYQEALRIVEAKNAAAARENKEKITKAKVELLKAMKSYVEAVTGKPMDTDFLKSVEKELDRVEQLVNLKPAEKKCQCKNNTKSDEEKIADFMRIIGALM